MAGCAPASSTRRSRTDVLRRHRPRPSPDALHMRRHARHGTLTRACDAHARAATRAPHATRLSCAPFAPPARRIDLRVKIVDFASYKELPAVCFESLGGVEKAKAIHKQLRAARKAAMAAAGLLPTAAAPQSSGATTASDASEAVGGKRSLGAGEADGGAPAAKEARAGHTNVPLQREASMGNGELIDGGNGAFKLNLVRG
jgi:hypothetical protein